MPILENFNLQSQNTFHIQTYVRYFAQITRIEEIQEILSDPKYKKLPKLLLGNGSNILFTQNFDGIIFQLNLYGIKRDYEDSEYVWLTIQAGEVWENLVEYTLEKDYSGIENLTAIPGTVGAAPVQNIGAYGAELKDCLEKVIVFDINQQCEIILDKSQCQFSYRHSLFQKEKQYWITGIQLKLRKHFTSLNTQYIAIQEEIQKSGHSPNNIRDIANIIRNIRQQKLPNPDILGNAGSFFKNPQISSQQYQQLKEQFPQLVSYPTENSDQIKIAAGWLIDQCGWKGKRIGNVGTYPKQALILVNYGNATGHEILTFAAQIQDSVYQKFGIALTSEVVIV